MANAQRTAINLALSQLAQSLAPEYGIDAGAVTARAILSHTRLRVVAGSPVQIYVSLYCSIAEQARLLQRALKLIRRHQLWRGARLALVATQYSYDGRAWAAQVGRDIDRYVSELIPRSRIVVERVTRTKYRDVVTGETITRETIATLEHFDGSDMTVWHELSERARTASEHNDN